MNTEDNTAIDADTLKAQWNEIKAAIVGLELDVLKAIGGNAAAGVRARHGLRNVRTSAQGLVKGTTLLMKSKKAK